MPYKIVAVRSGVRKSFAYAVRGDDSVNVDYRTDGITAAKIGGLLVFRTLRDAQRCPGHDAKGAEIWKVRCRKAVKLPTLRLGNPFIQLHNVKQLWEGDTLPMASRWPWPKGTQAFKYVELIECVSFLGGKNA